VYAEHFARRGALSQANQAVTSNSMPNADPSNINLLRGKYPEPSHPDPDPVCLRSILSRSSNLRRILVDWHWNRVSW
jgi:hypothetical protein